MDAAHVVALDPGRCNIQGMHKGHMHMVVTGQDESCKLGADGGRGLPQLGLQLHGILIGNGLHIRQQRPHHVLQLLCVQLANVTEGVQLQPKEQPFLPAQLRFARSGGGKGLTEILQVRGEGALFPLGPLLAKVLAQGGQQLLVAAGCGIARLVQTGAFVIFQKFAVGSGFLRAFLGHDPPHLGGDAGRTEGTQNADALVALLHIEIAQILVAQRRLTDAVGKVGSAKADPLGGKLGIHIQKGQKAVGERTGATCGFGAHDAVGGDLHHAHIDVAVRAAGGQDVIQHQRLRGQRFILQLLQRSLLGAEVFFTGFHPCFLLCHGITSL